MNSVNVVITTSLSPIVAGIGNATVIITHYQRLLDHIVPDFVHVLYDGKIIKSGGKELALELEEKGYDWITKQSEE